MSETTKTKNTHLPECADCTRTYEKWCSFFEARMTCDRKQYLQQRREPFVDKPNGEADVSRASRDNVRPLVGSNLHRRPGVE